MLPSYFPLQRYCFFPRKIQRLRWKWLLLMVSLLCLLVLFPAAALSQEPVVDAGCGTATIDGVVRRSEWAEAAEVDLGLWEDEADALQEGGGVSPAQEPAGVMLVMNDLDALYVAALLDLLLSLIEPISSPIFSVKISVEGKRSTQATCCP